MALEEVPRGSETILLVEPDPETRKLAAFMLAKQGYTVLEARNAAEAFQHYQERGWEVDLLLTELMSEVNGQELARVLEAKDPKLGVVYISDTDNRRLTRRIAARTKAVFLRRPFTMRLLADKVRQVLDTQQRRRVVAAGA
jgi:two-component system, cell cycle sensor histidine kinase and response regulator CckA